MSSPNAVAAAEVHVDITELVDWLRGGAAAENHVDVTAIVEQVITAAAAENSVDVTSIIDQISTAVAAAITTVEDQIDVTEADNQVDVTEVEDHIYVQPKNGPEHEDNVTANIEALYPEAPKATQVTLRVTNLRTNEIIKIRPDMIISFNNDAIYAIIEAKFSALHNLTDPEFDLSRTVTENQYDAFGWIARGDPVTCEVRGTRAEALGLYSGSFIALSQDVQIHVNGPDGIVSLSY